MKPLTWSETELLQSKASDHDKTERRYSLDNENFDYHSPLEIFWVLDGQKLLTEGAAYFAADFALVEPECFDQVEEFLQRLELRFFEKFENAYNVDFKDVDAVAKAALQRAIDGWITQHVHVERQWCMVGKSEQLEVTKNDLPHQSQQVPISVPPGAKPAQVRRLIGLRRKMTPKIGRQLRHASSP